MKKSKIRIQKSGSRIQDLGSREKSGVRNAPNFTPLSGERGGGEGNSALRTQRLALSTPKLPLGPVILDIPGKTLTAEDKKRLLHPATGGVILFTRNYESREQLTHLTEEIHSLRTPPLLIAVDHEGGRVQRFRQEFTAIPPMRILGQLWDQDPKKARKLALDTGFILAKELRDCGVDFSFTPVLDIDFGRSSVIGDRAFHHDPQAIAQLSGALMRGMKKAGMINVGKHFPGHGYVEADSHHEIPIDIRQMKEIKRIDLIPYKKLIAKLDAIMPAHVIYPDIDNRPAGFSKIWLGDVLRKQLKFKGVIFSDDLKMEGAGVAGNIVERAQAALTAGCDAVLVCNDVVAAETLLAARLPINTVSARRLLRLIPN